jgi:hypothetical protein
MASWSLGNHLGISILLLLPSFLLMTMFFWCVVSLLCRQHSEWLWMAFWEGFVEIIFTKPGHYDVYEQW